MYIPKRYGQGLTERCPFCKRQATSKNSQGIPVCREHKSSTIGEMRCACGQYLDLRQGKFGVFFSCLSCGSVSRSKVFEFNDVALPPDDAKSSSGHGAPCIVKSQPSASHGLKAENQQAEAARTGSAGGLGVGKGKRAPREIVVRADDPLYFD
jgi:hypothetical protein